MEVARATLFELPAHISDHHNGWRSESSIHTRGILWELDGVFKYTLPMWTLTS